MSEFGNIDGAKAYRREHSGGAGARFQRPVYWVPKGHALGSAKTRS